MKMKFKQNQMMIGAGVILALLVLGGTIFAFTRPKATAPTETAETTKKKKISAPVNQISLEERPYVQIVPNADGRNLDLVVNTVNKPADSAEYELEYQAGTLLQGAFGLLELDTLPSTTKLLLGSCSAGGACTYHDDVQGGTLVLHFSGGEDYSLKQDWRYFDNGSSAETEFASKDAKFQLESAALAKQRFVIIYNSPGHPEGVEGSIVSEPYSLTASGALTGTADVTMRANAEGNLTIVGYDGSTWTEFETTTDGKTATAEVDLMELYLVVQK